MSFNITWLPIKDFMNGGRVFPSDLDDALADLGNQLAAVNVAGGFNEGPNTRGGKSVISGAGTRTNTAYGALSNGPDQVANVVLPPSGVLFVLFQALWQESVLGAARAAIFLNANQLKLGGNNAAPSAQEASIGGTNAGVNCTLVSFGGGLYCPPTIGAGSASQVTTGQVFAAGGASGVFGGAALIFAAAGTYNVSVQFKASSGTVTASSRTLLAWTRNQ